MIDSWAAIAANYITHSVAVITIIEVAIVPECILNIGFTIVFDRCGLFGKRFIWTKRRFPDSFGFLNRVTHGNPKPRSIESDFDRREFACR